jgi:hypothetical protein
MKTQEQNTADIVKYLKETGKHVFMRQVTPTSLIQFFKVTEKEDGTFFCSNIDKDKTTETKIDIAYWVKNYAQDAKNVIKNNTFYKDHHFKSIKRKYFEKYTREL